MKNSLKYIYSKLRAFCFRFPLLIKLISKAEILFKSKLTSRLPAAQGNEIPFISTVLSSYGWNMNYAKPLVHERFEQQFAEYIGTKYAIAVNTGGMAIQMSIRALGLKPGDEIIHQVDTCVANAFACINAQINPVFVDSSTKSLMIDHSKIESHINSRTKAIMPVHLWGNPENMDTVLAFAKKHNLFIIEDSCLSLGAIYKTKKTGSLGTVGVFSMGCLKPIQTGEGGIITTNDEALARELTTLRAWGESRENHTASYAKLSWNGRMSEFIAALGLAQLEGYQDKLEMIRENANSFINEVNDLNILNFPEKEIAHTSSSYNQILLRLNETSSYSNKYIIAELRKNGIIASVANFEPINQISFFRSGEWENWIHKGDKEFLKKNYQSDFKNSMLNYNASIAIGKEHFLSKITTEKTIRIFRSTLKKIADK